MTRKRKSLIIAVMMAATSLGAVGAVTMLVTTSAAIAVDRPRGIQSEWPVKMNHKWIFEGNITMKRKELKKRLQKMGVPANLYNLDGAGRTDERFCLEFVDHEWQVYFSERGVKTTLERFASEDEACEFIDQQLS